MRIAQLIAVVFLTGCFDPGYSLRIWREELVVNSVSRDADEIRFVAGISRQILVDHCRKNMECFEQWIQRRLVEKQVCGSHIVRIAYLANGGEVQASGVCDAPK